ncbi:hypothetical protein [Aliamphritea hakodatensis]|uniref:hypothetical protein n=1 Tax=Aliamphritea hakodatensis TaxID=2895352 RepID=UPI0022FD5257|nr:hypothetical protein [Aliamphritea hakodatensis]
MDTTSIVIIIIATLAAIIFKYVLYKKICRWMDNDLAKGLAEGNAEKHSFLQQQLDQMRLDKVNRKEYPARLNELADQYDQQQ